MALRILALVMIGLVGGIWLGKAMYPESAAIPAPATVTYTKVICTDEKGLQKSLDNLSSAYLSAYSPVIVTKDKRGWTGAYHIKDGEYCVIVTEKVRVNVKSA